MFLNKIICKKEISSKEIERNSFNSIIVNSYSFDLLVFINIEYRERYLFVHEWTSKLKIISFI